MSDETNEKKRRLMSLVDSGINYKVHNGKRRRLCAINDCGKQAQRKALCARHLTESENQRLPTRSVTGARQSSAHPTIEQLEPDSTGSFHLDAFTEASNHHVTLDKYG